MLSSKLYSISPIPIQNALLTVRALSRNFLRENKSFARLYKTINHSQWLNESELKNLQTQLLSELLKHALLYVPFYQDLPITTETIQTQSMEAIHQFPLLDKMTVRECAKRLISQKHQWPLFKGSTSGTTGTPLTLYQNLFAINRENVFIHRQLEWAGFCKEEKRVWLRGDLIVPVDQINAPFWRHNYADRMLMCSSYHLSEKNIPLYLDAIYRFDPTIIQAYPSSISFLAKWLEANNKEYAGRSLKGIVTSSEMLNIDQQHLIQRRFGCNVFDWYGQFERVAAIGTCEYGQHHLISDYSYVELLPTDEGLHEIIGTGFNNYAMPLIRYRTGDFVKLDQSGRKCQCGRSFPLIEKVTGRSDDVIKLPDGRHIGRLDHIFKGVTGIIEAQIRQDRIDKIDILVVPASSFNEEAHKTIIHNAYDRLGSDVSIKVIIVEKITRTRNGKLRGVISNV